MLAERVYLALSGSVVADSALVRRLGHADFLTRLVYNAAIDLRVPFADAFAHRYALAEARRTGEGNHPPPSRRRPSCRSRAPTRSDPS